MVDDIHMKMGSFAVTLYRRRSSRLLLSEYCGIPLNGKSNHLKKNCTLVVSRGHKVICGHAVCIDEDY